MPQKLNLTPEQVNEVEKDQDAMYGETIPTIEGAEAYFSFVNHNGTKVLCLLHDDGREKVWKVTNQQELMRFIM